MTPVQSLLALPGVSVISVDNLQEFLGQSPDHVALVFSGETKRRPEAQDVAVVMREIARLYHGQVRIGVLDGVAEDKVKARFGVVVLPTVMLVKGTEVLTRITRIQDWSAYTQAFAEHFGPAAPRVAA